MKKIIIACCLFAVSLESFSILRIPLYPEQDHPIKMGSEPHRIPLRPLMVEFDNYTLSFNYGFDQVVTVELLNEDENIVYTDFLAPSQTSLTFPSTLSGEYTICLTVGSIYYLGVIEL